MKIVVHISWRYLWQLFWFGSETVTLPDGGIIEFTWGNPPLLSSSSSHFSSNSHGDGCYVRIKSEIDVERLGR